MEKPLLEKKENRNILSFVDIYKLVLIRIRVSNFFFACFVVMVWCFYAAFLKGNNLWIKRMFSVKVKVKGLGFIKKKNVAGILTIKN
jgi:hypothetical protein